MRSVFTALFLSLTLTSSLMASEPNIQARLDASAAKCRIDGASAYTQAEIILNRYGEKSKRYSAALKTAYADAKSCVGRERELMKPFVKEAAEKEESLRPAILDAYAKWLSYMDWLSTPSEWGSESQQSRSYEDASNRLKAELELR